MPQSSKDKLAVVRRQSMTVNEQRLLLAFIRQLPLNVPPLPVESEFVLTVEQAQELFAPVKDDNISSVMYEAVSALWGRNVQIPLRNGDVLKTSFVSSIVWGTGQESNKTVAIRFSPQVLPYLYMLKVNFSNSDSLNNVVKLTNFYAVRLYELLMGWVGSGRRQGRKSIGINQLREFLGMGDQYGRITQFRHKVLETAVSQINASTDFQLDFEFEKSGRVYKHVMFTWEHNKEKIWENPI
ncbi:replication initiation protein [Conchiformibius steedae]|uniref:replication initiation protein n=1 Tax=Conchiformibius steedae TaxID=153493 RepID=UPI0026EDE14C|nr:replication initiation protein [Conchiformibius steedae]